MKTVRILATAFFAVAMSAGFVSCSEEGGPKQPEVNTDDYHFDLLMSVGGTTGMSTTGVTSALIRSVKVSEVEDSTFVISMQGQGADITETLNAESVIKGAYYYEAAPRKNTWYGKYQIGNTISTLSRYEFDEITFLDRQYAHAWTSDNTLVLLGADRSVSSRGSNPALTNTIQWARLIDGSALTLEDEGTLDLTTATEDLKEGGLTAFSTSGLAAYRKSDNTIIYAFIDKATKNAMKGVFVAFIDAATMEIKNVAVDETVDEMSGTAYGELQQDKMFFDENSNLYIPCGTKIEGAAYSSAQTSKVLRIKNGAYEFDKTYEGGASIFKSKIIAADYLGNGKAIIYVTDPVNSGLCNDLLTSTSKEWGQNAFNGLYYIYDINNCTISTIPGLPTAGNCGTFADRVTVFNGKAYIGVFPEEPAPSRIYVYDPATGKATAGAKIESGYYFNRVSVLANK